MNEIWIRIVGEFTVDRGDRRLTPTAVGTRKARRLLGFLASDSGRTTSIERLVDAVWGEAPPKDSVGNLAVLVSRLRGVLGGEVITGGRFGYRLGSSVTVDLGEAARLVTAAERLLALNRFAEALPPATSSLDLLRDGPVLPDQPDAAWVRAARKHHGNLLRRARHATASAALYNGDVWLAREVAEAAVDDEATDEIAARALMRAHWAAGEPVWALSAYMRLRSVLVEEFGLEPAPSTRQVHLEILQGAAG